jgi:hypothetical protein
MDGESGQQKIINQLGETHAIIRAAMPDRLSSKEEADYRVKIPWNLERKAGSNGNNDVEPMSRPAIMGSDNDIDVRTICALFLNFR